jgi:hypothetical protein
MTTLSLVTRIIVNDYPPRANCRLTLCGARLAAARTDVDQPKVITP